MHWMEPVQIETRENKRKPWSWRSGTLQQILCLNIAMSNRHRATVML